MRNSILFDLVYEESRHPSRPMAVTEKIYLGIEKLLWPRMILYLVLISMRHYFCMYRTICSKTMSWLKTSSEVSENREQFTLGIELILYKHWLALILFIRIINYDLS